MKKSLLLSLLLPSMAVACFAQESRQDASISISGIFPPYVSGRAVQETAHAHFPGGLLSYRYMLTPRSAAEVNYQYIQNTNHFYAGSALPDLNIKTKMQEISAAYVFNFTYKKFNPFLEGGVGGYLFSPLDTTATQILDVKRTTNIGALYGGGIAYEISPSFDIRAEYRGIVVKAPNFGFPSFTTNRWYNISNPVIGVAYHF